MFFWLGWGISFALRFSARPSGCVLEIKYKTLGFMGTVALVVCSGVALLCLSWRSVQWLRSPVKYWPHFHSVCHIVKIKNHTWLTEVKKCFFYGLTEGTRTDLRIKNSITYRKRQRIRHSWSREIEWTLTKRLSDSRYGKDRSVRRLTELTRLQGWLARKMWMMFYLHIFYPNKNK